MVIFSSFTSIPGVAKHLAEPKGLGFLPFPWLIRQDFNSYDKILAIRSPLIIAHGAKDTMIPAEMSRQLYHHAGSKQKRLILDPHGHHGVSTYLLIKELESLKKAH